MLYKQRSDEGSGREMGFHPPKRSIFQVAIFIADDRYWTSLWRDPFCQANLAFAGLKFIWDKRDSV